MDGFIQRGGMVRVFVRACVRVCACVRARVCVRARACVYVRRNSPTRAQAPSMLRSLYHPQLDTHTQTRDDSSEQVISPEQRPLPTLNKTNTNTNTSLS